MRCTPSRPRRLFGALLLACLLGAPVTLVAQPSDGDAVEAQLAVELARLDEQLGLGTFPDGSGIWVARLAAALEHRGETVLAGQLRGLGVSRALEGAGDDPLHGTLDAARNDRVESVARELDRLWTRIESGAPAAPAGRSVDRSVDRFVDRFVDPSAGRLSGTVVDRATGDGLAAFVSVLAVEGTLLTSTVSDAEGRYVAADLPAGAYRLLVETHRHGAALYGGVPCPTAARCDRTAGHEVVVAAGTETSGVDLRLEALGSITGTVTAEATGGPVEGIWIEVRGEDGSQAGATYSSADGTYEVASLPAGSYYLRTTVNSPTYDSELYDDLPCSFWSCDPTDGTPVVVGAATATPNIDFSLELLGSISGSVTERDGGAPVLFGTVEAYDAQGTLRRTTQQEPDGSYVLRYMPAGTYTVRSRTNGYQFQLWDGITCHPTCDLSTGDPVAVAPGAEVTGIDFPLARLGTVTGTVTFALDDPRPGLDRSQVKAYRENGEIFMTRTLSEDGTYRLAGFDPGRYYVTTSTRAFVDQIHPGVPCPSGCDLEDGVLIQVGLDSQVTGVDFHLDRLGVLEVFATEADTGLFRPGQVEVYDGAGDLVRWRFVMAPGAPLTGLAPGSYYVRYGSDWSGGDTHQDELYPDIPCEPDCDVTRGTPVSVALNGLTTLDMPLTPCPGWTVAEVKYNIGWSPVLFACQELIVRQSRVEAGESLTLQSGRLVVMGDGFVVEDGASLVVEIVPEWAEASP